MVNPNVRWIGLSSPADAARNFLCNENDESLLILERMETSEELNPAGHFLSEIFEQ